MTLTEISSGDTVIGYAWFCENELNGGDYCDGCADASDDEIPTTYPTVGERSRFATDDTKGDYDVEEDTRTDVSRRIHAGQDPAEAQTPARTPYQLDLPLAGRDADHQQG